MKKGLLGGTALAGAAALTAGIAGAAEAPEWKLSGNANFQAYYVDQDFNLVVSTWTDSVAGVPVFVSWLSAATGTPGIQDHGWYFGVDEAELQLIVSGSADNGLNYGFKVEVNASTTDGADGIADEARIELSGSWGTLQMGDEDGAEDIMNVGGEDLMGATGGFDGDFDDVLLRTRWIVGGLEQFAAPSYPTIAGDTGDQTKLSYYSPRFSGFQVGASLTPTPNNGDDFKADGHWENHYGLGASYDVSFRDLRIRASGVYSASSSNSTGINDISAWSVGGIVDWGAFSLGANYTDNGDSGTLTEAASAGVVTESSYWNVAAGFERGPFYLSVGYFSSVRELSGPAAVTYNAGDSTVETISLAADHSFAPGLTAYAEIDFVSDELYGNTADNCVSGFQDCTNDATIFILGANVSF